MSPQVNWTAVATVLGASSWVGTTVLAVVCRYQRTALAEAVARIDALAGRLARLETRDDAPRVERTNPRTAPAVTSTPRTAHRHVEPGTPTAAIGPTLIAVPNLAAPSAGRHSASLLTSASAELGRRFGAIWELADTGATADSIARATQYPVGQVELILGLRRQLATGAGAEGSNAS